MANELRESVASLDGTEENAVAAANIATATTTDTTSALASDLPPAEVVGSDGEDDAGKATEANSKVEVEPLQSHQSHGVVRPRGVVRQRGVVRPNAKQVPRRCRWHPALTAVWGTLCERCML
jgi:hypothetical protein